MTSMPSPTAAQPSQITRTTAASTSRYADEDVERPGPEESEQEPIANRPGTSAAAVPASNGPQSTVDTEVAADRLDGLVEPQPPP